MTFQTPSQISPSQFNFAKPQNRKRVVWAASAAVAVIVIAIVYFGSSPAPSVVGVVATTTPEKTKAQSIDEILNKINFDADFLRNQDFRELQVPTSESLDVQQKGRSHPFSPF